MYEYRRGSRDEVGDAAVAVVVPTGVSVEAVGDNMYTHYTKKKVLFNSIMHVYKHTNKNTQNMNIERKEEEKK
jgi:hypothetical protein